MAKWIKDRSLYSDDELIADRKRKTLYSVSLLSFHIVFAESSVRDHYVFLRCESNRSQCFGESIKSSWVPRKKITSTQVR